jgi:hypothetical protein
MVRRTSLLLLTHACGGAGFLLGLGQETPTGNGNDKSKDKQRKPAKTPPPIAVIAGTVFRDPGFAFPGARIRLEPAPQSATSDTIRGKVKVKVKKMEAVSDQRGEFAFRVPPVPMRYNLSITATGHLPDQREVIVAGEGRQDVFVTLKPAP